MGTRERATGRHATAAERVAFAVVGALDLAAEKLRALGGELRERGERRVRRRRAEAPSPARRSRVRAG